ncbi:MAG: DNA mismatch repair endonuclease MutL [Simkaniaceae bacterium]|nr:DNA mismatch repair endonuclease MutL [Simkaniaceae bacterium]
MSKIRVLSDSTVNKIAAGEVIEDPASVVKELVENAIDSGASEISIATVGGGFELIRISDNGCGMSKDDALLAFERHATSKLSHVEDLNHLHTMGFRGEALASIGAVSKVELVTSDGKGTKIVFEGSRMLHEGVASRSQGTTISVRKLFYNVPARMKFQKSQTACANAITRLVKREALSCPEITFRLDESFSAVEKGWRNRAGEVLGAGFIDGMRPIEEEGVHGFVGMPDQCRGNRLGQYLFINGRPVVCPLIAEAVTAAYGTRIESRNHPIFVLYFDIPPEWVDVNVHPQKREVRLREEEKILSPLAKAIEKMLRKPLAPVAAPKMQTFTLRESPTFSTPPPPVEQMPLTFEPQFDVLGRVGSYLLLEWVGEEGITLVHLKRARARLLYDQLLERLEGKKGDMQTLMFPITLEFSPNEMEILNARLKDLELLGIAMRPFGEETMLVDSLSPSLDQDKLKELIDELIGIFSREGDQAKLALASTTIRFCVTREGGGIDEGKALVRELMKSSCPEQSPFNKPIMVKIDEAAIESLFKSYRNSPR